MAASAGDDGAVRPSSKNPYDLLGPKPNKEPALDVSRVNDLLANVDNRLSGGLHGAFYESGSRLDSNTRHGQLEALFELKSQLSDVQASLTKQAQRSEAADNEKQAKGPGKPSGNMVSTIKNVVQQEMSDKLRDLTIRLDRVKESVKKDREAHLNQIKSLETKVKKLGQQDKTEKAYDAKIKVLEKKLKQLEEYKPSAAAQAKQNVQINNAVTGFNKARLDALEDCKNAHATRIHQLELWKAAHVQQHSSIDHNIRTL
jgi:myosin heavy subunit